jgi:hypothetical protein
MNEAATGLSAWANVYVIVGSSGGALIGLQFVVITLIAERRRGTHGGALGAFGTPTVVHLAGALVVSVVMSAPWPSTRMLSTALFVGGVLGLTYGAIVFVRARRQTGYEPVWEDWIWYVALPCVVYVMLIIIAVFLRTDADVALFGVAAIALALLLIGIHNAWDTVTHLLESDTDAR